MNMKNSAWKTYVFWILVSEAVGLLAGLLIRDGTQIYAETIIKPPLAPPQWVFPAVWAILYALMGISAARVSLSLPSPQRSLGLNLMVTQLIVNFFWPLLFFNAQAFGFALMWLILLWVLVLLMILAYRNVDPLAAWLQVPYLLWLTFALYLNAAVWYLNR